MARQTQPRLAFRGDPVFHDGSNVTVRLGEKWIKHFLAGRKNCVVLNGDGKRIGTAVIGDVFYLPMYAVRDEWLRFVENPGASWASTFRDLEFRYGDGVSPSHYVSVVWFTFTND